MRHLSCGCLGFAVGVLVAGAPAHAQPGPVPPANAESVPVPDGPPNADAGSPADADAAATASLDDRREERAPAKEQAAAAGDTSATTASAALATPPASGQPTTTEEPGVPTFGGMGYGAAGVMVGPITGASAHLERALGDDGALGGLGWQLGGGGKALLWGLVIGGKGFFLAYPETATARGSASLRGGGGGFDLGYAVVHRADLIVVPFVGIGGIGFDLSVANITDEPLSFGSEEIAGGEDGDFSGGFWYLEGGVGAHRFTMRNGGPELGLEVGVMASFSSQEWTNTSDDTVDGVPSPKFAGAYVKVTGGGGGFFLKD